MDESENGEPGMKKMYRIMGRGSGGKGGRRLMVSNLSESPKLLCEHRPPIVGGNSCQFVDFIRNR